MLSEAKYKAKYRNGLKILSSKQILQRLLTALAKVKTGSIFGALLNETRQIIFSSYQEKSIHQYNKFNKIMKQKRCYIYEFWE